jgi:Fe-S-cluster-containing hydrogenase component 2
MTAQPFSNQYTAFCMRCGRPLKKHEKALRVCDHGAIDFEEREPVDIMFHFCVDCKEEMLKWFADGVRGAVERMKDKQKSLAELDAADKQKQKLTPL